VTTTREYTNPEDRASRIHELEQSLTRQATEFPGVMPVEAKARFEADRIELDRHRADRDAWNERQSFLQTLAERGTNVEPSTAPAVISRPAEADIYDLDSVRRMSRTREEYGLKVRDNALRAVDITRFPDIADQAAVKNRMVNLIEFHDSDENEYANRVLVTGSPVYKRAFSKYVTGKTPTPEEQFALERAAMAVGVDATGGFAVPFAFDPDFIRIGAWTSVSPYRSGAVRTETIVGTDTWRGVTSTAVTWAYALEAAATTEGAPTLAQPELIVKRAQGFATVSYEILQDRPDLGSELAALFAEAKDTYEENQFTLGTGLTVFPQGTGLKDAFTRVDTATTVVLVIQDIRNTANALPIRHRQNAVWLLSRAAIQFIQGLETVGGQLFNGVNYASVGTPQQNPGGNTGLRLLGYPVYETPSMTFTPTVADSTWGVILNPQAYLVVDRLGMSVELVPNLFDATTGFPTGQRGFLAFARNTAKVINIDGGRQGAIL
jgi:HK97 family phage major capsid protein